MKIFRTILKWVCQPFTRTKQESKNEPPVKMYTGSELKIWTRTGRERTWRTALSSGDDIKAPWSPFLNWYQKQMSNPHFQFEIENQVCILQRNDIAFIQIDAIQVPEWAWRAVNDKEERTDEKA